MDLELTPCFRFKCCGINAYTVHMKEWDLFYLIFLSNNYFIHRRTCIYYIPCFAIDLSAWCVRHVIRHFGTYNNLTYFHFGLVFPFYLSLFDFAAQILIHSSFRNDVKPCTAICKKRSRKKQMKMTVWRTRFCNLEGIIHFCRHIKYPNGIIFLFVPLFIQGGESLSTYTLYSISIDSAWTIPIYESNE